MPNSWQAIWLPVLVACISGSIAITVVERWMAVRYPKPILGSWPRWLRPGQTGWLLLNTATWLGTIVLMTQQLLPVVVGLPLIWLQMVLTCIVERRHAWENAEPASDDETESLPSG